jgi:hypothetical protein
MGQGTVTQVSFLGDDQMKIKFTALTSALVLGSASLLQADTSVEAKLEAMEAQLRAQQAEIQQLRSSSGDSWLNERRAEEVKTLVRDVLADADTRASLAEGGLTAGHRDHFFIASEDGSFLLNVSGQVQTRYIYNVRRDNMVNDFESAEQRRKTHGMDIRRAKIGFHGHIYDPRFTYGVRGNFAAGDFVDLEIEGETVENAFQETGGFRLEEAWFGIEFADGWQVKLGQFKAPFLREELVYSAHQLAVERSLTSDLFSAGYTQGVQLSYSADMFRVAAMMHQGSRAANTSWNRPASQAVDFAIAARAEVLVAGNWAQFNDFTTWSTDSTGIMLGAAINYENAASGALNQANDVLRWTVDASLEFPELMGLNVFAAIIGNHPQGRGGVINGDPQSSGATHVDQWGVVLQAGVFAIPDKMDVFIRWEYLDLMNQDLDGVDRIESRKSHTLTFGTNYYLRGHAAKASDDVVWFLDPVALSVPGSGALESVHSDQVALRAQFQFLF